MVEKANVKKRESNGRAENPTRRDLQMAFELYR
jgi:hypothetical protein